MLLKVIILGDSGCATRFITLFHSIPSSFFFNFFSRRRFSDPLSTPALPGRVGKTSLMNQ
jgi:hypothetical protein